MTVCTLHKLIEQIETKTVRRSICFRGFEKFADDILDAAQILAPRAMCFHMGDAVLSMNGKTIPELFILPYEVCWFEGEFNGQINLSYERIGMLCIQKDGVIGVHVYSWKNNEWALISAAACHQESGKIKSVQASAGDRFSSAAISWLAAYLSALNCCNITRVKTTPDEKLQRARSKRGKKPLFAFWTLEIDLERSDKEGCDWGGTHASPRFHLRRGHARQHKKGHWCWVRACAVGNKNSGGMVHKEYAAR